MNGLGQRRTSNSGVLSLLAVGTSLNRKVIAVRPMFSDIETVYVPRLLKYSYDCAGKE